MSSAVCSSLLVAQKTNNALPRQFVALPKGLMAKKMVAKASRSVAARAEVGLFFATTTGNTEEVADEIKSVLGDAVSDPQDIGDVEIGDLAGYDGLIVGAPTWNTGADDCRSGTAWDDVLSEIEETDFAGKKVAIFGCGDSSSYSDYFCDAIEELHSTFARAGAELVGEIAIEGYEFDCSKSAVGGALSSDDTSGMVGLAIDADNQSDMTEDRVAAWCDKLKGEMAL